MSDPDPSHNGAAPAESGPADAHAGNAAAEASGWSRFKWRTWGRVEGMARRLYPQVRPDLERLEWWKRYFQAVVILPVLVSGAGLLWLLWNPVISLPRWIGMGVVLLAMLALVYGLFAGGIVSRLWGFAGCAAATVALGVAGFAWAIMEAFTAFWPASGPGGGVPVSDPTAGMMYLLVAAGAGVLAVAVLVHLVLLILVSIRIRALAAMQLVSAAVVVGSDLARKIAPGLAQLKRWRQPVEGADPPAGAESEKPEAGPEP